MMWLLRLWGGLTAASGLEQKEGQQEATRRRFSPHPAAPGDTEEERGRRREFTDTTENNASSSLGSSHALTFIQRTKRVATSMLFCSRSLPITRSFVVFIP